jgi:hypothetical protein
VARPHWLGLASSALALIGCAPVLQSNAGSTERYWLPAYAFGAVAGGELDLRDVCRSGRAEELAIGATWLTVGVSVLTLGVYTPREARVRCAPPR